MGVVTCNDISNDPRMAPWRDQARARGYLSSAAVPLKRGDEVVGAFTVYAATPGFFDIEIMQLLTEIGQDISFALDNMVHERNRLAVKNELQQLNEHLERRVAERTCQLEATNQELESFSYSVSHDLRTPLRAIDGFSRILADNYVESLDDKGKDYLGRILRASKRMGILIDDLLRLSQVSRAEIAKAKVGLSVMAQAVAGELHSADPSRKIEWVIQEGGWVEGDPRLLRIVLENLLGNAWKFTAKQPSARIEFGYAGQDGETVVFIKDNGAGFDMAYHNKLFGAFQRLHSADDFEGTGIGLATVQRIIQRHGGRIWAEGQVGAGATFYFALKCAG
jgi:light-regulated signal transduction histidine kinase (bacteriophytochrome)